ncbi:MAG: hypothetical protein A3A33_01525 [Candidatus Yanofskybacteria bacterium RIFCSPLOWO2_01_FULL_49_25]|uniref:Methyltransferase n=1 Tax=Candidatus Yanofskybacteria bacterium RIFCSPLOWO2_01_FULL_49_25 TaxID=1802701 RepID=A0A1F8GX53_9BACT|nr:MAG: hypothetical protein A3A33_01525 [Candidatus Yanofskybacteria bacterium RIFCSPLOWO2_01_FULL_49_25]
MQNVFQRTTCRACNSPDLVSILNLGSQPPANAFVKPEEFETEQAFPLEVFFCRSCTLVQLLYIVSPELLFRNYVYVSSTSPVFQEHFRQFASFIMDRYLKPGQLAVDIGSNDGILLKPLKERGARVMGVDPATDIAARATKEGIPTLPHFFTPVVAETLKRRLGPAHVITGTNVFAHVDDIQPLLEGVAALLAPEGVFIIEAPYLIDFLTKRLFDTVYHEHVSYYSVRSLQELVGRVGFRVIDVQKVNTHGGSIRVSMVRESEGRQRQPSVDEFLELEKREGLYQEETYHAFARLVEKNKQELTALLKDLKAQGKRIAGYGAPAKGNTLLNYMNIGPDILDYIVDDSAYKQGLYTPGMHIPVASLERLVADQPDFVFILAWNFADAIMKRCRTAIGDKAQYIIPVPTPTIL